jgi:hypothetical protein
MKLILDLDGVLITTPAWRVDEIDADGYSKFDMKCVSYLNTLLASYPLEIWLRVYLRIKFFKINDLGENELI